MEARELPIEVSGNGHVRPYDPTRDAAFLRHCVLELQSLERGLDPRLPPGEAMVEPYCSLLLERCRDWEGAIFVAEEEGVQVGIVTVFARVPSTEPDEPGEPFALISDLFVVPYRRNRGVASSLLRKAEAHARSCGAGVLRLEVMADNMGARAYYQRLGWRDRVVEMERLLLPDLPVAPEQPTRASRWRGGD